MSSDIEQKVVSIKFDNSNFESRIASTLASLDKLSHSLQLEGAGNGFDEVSRAAGNMDLSSIASNVDNISGKFSALGAIGFAAIQTVTSGLLGFAGKMADRAKTDIFEPIITGGSQRAKNIEQAQFMFKGLHIDVEKGMASSLAAVQGTAYGLDEAAKAAAQFGASGVKVGDEMTGALRGVAGSAAMTGSSFSEMADIFAGSAGSGVVNNQDLMQFATRGLNAASAVGKVLGKTEAQIHSMAKDGKLDFKTFAKAMDTAFGKHATEANQTYQGSLANLHAAMSRMGASFLGPLHTQQRDLFNAVTPVIDKATKALQPLFNTLLGLQQIKTIGAINKINKIDFSNLKLAIPLISKGITNAFIGVSRVLSTVKKAFRDIFPKSETSLIVSFAQKFAAFTEHLKMGAETANKLRLIFGGVFSVIRIGIEIVKGIFHVFGALFQVLKYVADRFNLMGDGVGTLSARLAWAVTKLKVFLVEGGGLQRFFDKVAYFVVVAGVAIFHFVQRVIDAAVEFKNFVQELFGGAPSVKNMVSTLAPAQTVFERLTLRIREVSQAISDFLQWVTGAQSAGGAFTKISDGARTAFGKIGDGLRTFKDQLSSAFNDKDFQGLTDLFNVGLLAGIFVAIKRLVDGGLKINIKGGLIDKVKEMFDGLTTTLHAMQTELKAKALMEIAIAIGVLTLSLLVLSTIDSGALTKALTATAVGMGQLVGAMALLGKMDIKGGKMIAIAAGLILLAGAVFILSLAVKVMASMDTGELIRGMAGVAVAIGLLLAATKLIENDSDGMIRAGIAMGLMSIALLLLAAAVKAFSMMSWAEMAQGLVGAAIGLGILTAAVNQMPKGMVAQGAGLILLAIGLKILASVIKSFASMSWGEMTQGLIGLTVALGVLAASLNLMPSNMISIGAGLILISTALSIMSGVIKILGGLGLAQLATGIGAVAAILLILAIAAKAMQDSIAGAVAIAIIAASLYVLAGVISQLGKMSIAEIATGLGALAVAFLLIGAAAIGASYIAGPLFILAAALVAIGIGATLLGIGAILIATGIGIMIKAGDAGVQMFERLLDIVIKNMPKMVTALVNGLTQMVLAIMERAPAMVNAAAKIISALLDALIGLIPKLAETIGVLITALINLIRTYIPQFIQLGIDLLISLLTGIRDNIFQVTTLVLEIIVNFINAIAANIQMVIMAGVNLIMQFISGIITAIPLIVVKGVELINAFISGIISMELAIIGAGIRLLTSLMFGIASAIGQVVTAAVNILIQLVQTLADNYWRIINAGFDLIVQFIQGMTNNILKIVDAGATLVVKLVEGLGTAVWQIVDAAAGLLVSFLFGLGRDIQKVIDAGTDFVIKLIKGIAEAGIRIFNAAADTLVQFLWGIADAIRTHSKDINDAAWAILSAIADGLVKGMGGKLLDKVKDATVGLVKAGWDAAMDWISASSPSRKYMKMGGYIGQGLAIGMNKDKNHQAAAAGMAERTVSSFQNSLSNLSAKMIMLDDISPTISPVLDLTQVQRESQRLSGMMGVSPIIPLVSTNQARHIAHTTDQPNGSEGISDNAPETRDVKFEQHIYSPNSLSTADIYRNTKSQIALAKEKLGI